jgi:CHC2 zinc finger
MNDFRDLREKIAEAKRRLPLPKLMTTLGLAEHAKKSGRCPWHDDQHPSFSVFPGRDGFWHYKCFVCDTQGGDEIAFLVKHFDISRSEAIKRHLELAGFPTRRPPKSHEYPKSPASPVRPVCPVSEGQAVDGEMDKRLKPLAAQNACTQLNTARTRRFKLLRDLKAVEKEIGRKLQVAELAIAFDEWHRLSLPFLDAAKTRDYYEAKFLSEYTKVRFATGEGTLATALENVARLSPDQLPIIPAKPKAPESWRRLATLHRELSRLSEKPTHFLSYRDAAKVFDGMSHQEAHAITGALVTLGVIEIVSNGKPGVNGREASEFRYLLSQSDDSEQDDGGLVL